MSCWQLADGNEIPVLFHGILDGGIRSESKQDGVRFQNPFRHNSRDARSQRFGHPTFTMRRFALFVGLCGLLAQQGLQSAPPQGPAAARSIPSSGSELPTAPPAVPELPATPPLPQAAPAA